jgi:hypothetical protein
MRLTGCHFSSLESAQFTENFECAATFALHSSGPASRAWFENNRWCAMSGKNRLSAGML